MGKCWLCVEILDMFRNMWRSGPSRARQRASTQETWPQNFFAQDNHRSYRVSTQAAGLTSVCTIFPLFPREPRGSYITATAITSYELPSELGWFDRFRDFFWVYANFLHRSDWKMIRFKSHHRRLIRFFSILLP